MLYDMSLSVFCVLLLLQFQWINGGSVSERIGCTKNADCNSKSLVCCRNNICCSSRYHQKWRTKCFSDDDCKGIKDHFTKSVMNEHCCKSSECCSIYAYENEPDKANESNEHTKFLIIVAGTLLATAILIATIVTFWCSNDKNRSRRRSLSFQARHQTSIFETSPDDHCCGDVQTTCLEIDQGETRAELHNDQKPEEEHLTNGKGN